MSSEIMTTEVLEVLERIATASEKQARNTDPGAYHVPAIYPHEDGSYSACCYACSRGTEKLVAVCTLPFEERDYPAEWPTGSFFPDVNDKAIRRLEEVRKVAAAVMMDTPAGDPRQFVAQQILAVLTQD